MIKLQTDRTTDNAVVYWQ